MVLTNGLTTGICVIPLTKLLGKKIIIAFHGDISVYSPKWQKFIKFLTKRIDLMIVNSKGSYENICSIIPKNKIIINEHCADEIFFKVPLVDKRQRTSSFTILYVGRLTKDKMCLPLIKIAEKISSDHNFNFIFVGVGRYEGLVKKLSQKNKNVKYLGYINDRILLSKLYSDADLVWSFADETYLAIPAIEALSCGTPIIIPKIAAILQKIENRIEIDQKLVPRKVGWLVNPFDAKAIMSLIVSIKKGGISWNMRQSCRQYAQLKYSFNNLKSTIIRIQNLINIERY